MAILFDDPSISSLGGILTGLLRGLISSTSLACSSETGSCETQEPVEITHATRTANGRNRGATCFRTIGISLLAAELLVERMQELVKLLDVRQICRLLALHRSDDDLMTERELLHIQFCPRFVFRQLQSLG